MMVACRTVAAALAAVVVGPSAAHCAAVAHTGDARSVARVDNGGTGWSLGTIELDVVALPDSQTLRVTGRLTCSAPAGGSRGPDLVLAPDGMRFESIQADGATSTPSTARDTMHVRFDGIVPAGERRTIRFTLRAPRARLARSVALGAEGAYASWYGNWYPWLAAAKGAEPGLRASGLMTLTIPATWSGLATGRLVEYASANGMRRERWESRAPLVWSFIAAPYHVTRHRVDSTDVAIHLMPRQAAKAPAFAAAIPPMVRTLERAYGPYPFATFGLAAIPAGIAPPGIGGRSEMGYFLTHEHALDVDTVDVPIFAHELAHMWWANTVFSDPPGDDMVDEGMASHGATLVVEARYGRAAAHEYMREGSIANSAHTFFHLWRIGGDERLMNDFATLPSYGKGAWVYEMLRERVGDSVYFATLRQLVRDRAGRSTTLNDIRAAFVRVAPVSADLERFFADWLDRAGAPVVTLQWSPMTGAGASAARVTLAQRTTPYRLPLEIETVSRAGTRRVSVVLADSVQTFVIPARGVPTEVRLDPDHRVMLWEPSFGPIPGVTPPMSIVAQHAWFLDELRWLRRMYGVARFDVGVVRGGDVAWTSVSARGISEGTRTRGTEPTAWPLGELAAVARRLDPDAFPASRTHASIGTLADLWSKVIAADAARSAEVLSEITTRTDSLSGDPFRATARGGLGFRLATKRGAPRLSFVEVRDGHTIVLIGYPESRAGCVIVAESDRVGVGLATQIAQRLAMIERWPEYPGQD